MKINASPSQLIASALNTAQNQVHKWVESSDDPAEPVLPSGLASRRPKVGQLPEMSGAGPEMSLSRDDIDKIVQNGAFLGLLNKYFSDPRMRQRLIDSARAFFTSHIPGGKINVLKASTNIGFALAGANIGGQLAHKKREPDRSFHIAAALAAALCGALAGGAIGAFAGANPSLRAGIVTSLAATSAGYSQPWVADYLRGLEHRLADFFRQEFPDGLSDAEKTLYWST